MPELRQNMATKEWVIIATERARRPDEFAAEPRAMTHLRPAFDPECPFCPGHEEQTASELLRWPPGAGATWQGRVFANRYPALSPEGEREQQVQGIHRRVNGVGYHEVIVESPRHNTTPALLSPAELALTLKAFQTRGRAIMDDPRIEQLFFYKNHGPRAGQSIEHPHSQLLALPMVPHDVRQRIEELRRTIDDEGVCPYCRMAEMELLEDRRVVALNDAFIAFIPYAACSPFHLWIVPLRHGPTFLDLRRDELRALASILHEVFARLYAGLNDPDYNMIIRGAPNRDAASEYLHWYVSVVPRVTRAAGFELGSGMYINPSLPEVNARFLRELPLEKMMGDLRQQAGHHG